MCEDNPTEQKREDDPTEQKRAFGHFLRCLLEERGFDAAQFAPRIGLTANQLSRILNGTSGTTASRLWAIVQALPVSRPEDYRKLCRLANIPDPMRADGTELAAIQADAAELAAIRSDGQVVVPDGHGQSRPALSDEVADFKRRLMKMRDELDAMIARL